MWLDKLTKIKYKNYSSTQYVLARYDRVKTPIILYHAMWMSIRDNVFLFIYNLCWWAETWMHDLAADT